MTAIPKVGSWGRNQALRIALVHLITSLTWCRSLSTLLLLGTCTCLTLPLDAYLERPSVAFVSVRTAPRTFPPGRVIGILMARCNLRPSIRIRHVALRV